jgi:hypothetical protein
MNWIECYVQNTCIPSSVFDVRMDLELLSQFMRSSLCTTSMASKDDQMSAPEHTSMLALNLATCSYH